MPQIDVDSRPEHALMASECSAVALPCESISDDRDTPFTNALRPFVYDTCDFVCGGFDLTLEAGCIVGVLGDVSECVYERLLGSRWECAPNDGTTFVRLASCGLR
jgi:hypothetical protein